MLHILALIALYNDHEFDSLRTNIGTKNLCLSI